MSPQLSLTPSRHISEISKTYPRYIPFISFSYSEHILHMTYIWLTYDLHMTYIWLTYSSGLYGIMPSLQCIFHPWCYEPLLTNISCAFLERQAGHRKQQIRMSHVNDSSWCINAVFPMGILGRALWDALLVFVLVNPRFGIRFGNLTLDLCATCLHRYPTYRC